MLVVAKVWLAGNDEQIVITATNDTRSRYSAKGGFLRSSALHVEFSCAVGVLSFCRSTYRPGLARELELTADILRLRSRWPEVIDIACEVPGQNSSALPHSDMSTRALEMTR